MFMGKMGLVLEKNQNIKVENKNTLRLKILELDFLKRRQEQLEAKKLDEILTVVDEPHPTRIFIVPYRDRLSDKVSFLENMNILLADTLVSEPYEIYFAHQYDTRPFNRGAMKNIGFLAMKAKYPSAYKDITFIFHDVDTWPSEKDLIDYSTTPGIVRHFYGYDYTLGGMFAIKGADFEKSRGFPNFWGWGIEDNAMNDRCLKAGLTIDRSQFYDIADKRIARTFDGFNRIISKRDSLLYKQTACDDLYALKNLQWTFKNEYINVKNFECSMNPHEQIYEPIDVRITNKIIVPNPREFRRKIKMFY
jgi:hypothetical protein